MSDRNPMMQNANNPVPVLGAIPGKAFPDDELIDENMANAANPTIAQGCFPGGTDEINHDIMPLDTLICLKNSRTRGIDDAEPNEMGVAAVSGLCWDNYCSQREMEDAFYWGGIVQTEMRRTRPLDDGTMDPQSGFATIRAGTCSVINNGDQTFYPGNLIAMRFPLAPFHPKSDAGSFNGGSAIQAQARFGTPSGQFRPEYVPFDHTDFTVQMAAAFAASTVRHADNGVADIPFMNAIPSLNHGIPDYPWSEIQEGAIGYKYAFMGIGLTFLEHAIRAGIVTSNAANWGDDERNAFQRNGVQRNGVQQVDERTAHKAAAKVARAYGLWETDPAKQTPVLEVMADIMLKNIDARDNRRADAVARFQRGSGKDWAEISTTIPQDVDYRMLYAKLRLNLTEILNQGVTNAWNSKTSKIVGKAMNAAAPADTLHGLWGHFCM